MPPLSSSQVVPRECPVKAARLIDQAIKIYKDYKAERENKELRQRTTESLPRRHYVPRNYE